MIKQWAVWQGQMAVSLILIQLGAIKVWQYYLLPPEEQRMPGVKNPMCSAFPRVGQYQIMMWVPLCNLQHLTEKFAFSCPSSTIQAKKVRNHQIVWDKKRFCKTIHPSASTFLVAFCDYWRFGTGGHQENVNAVCILALNIINDKVKVALSLVVWWDQLYLVWRVDVTEVELCPLLSVQLFLLPDRPLTTN